MLQTLYAYRGQISWEIILSMLISYAMILLIALPVHELAHGWVANRLGDPTARMSGRLSLNPLAHLDPIGTLMIVLIGVGYAKPVPVDPRYFRNYKTGMVLTAAAGPVSNLLMGLLAIAVLKALTLFFPFGTAMLVAASMLVWFTRINITLAVFNLLPIPPLDGYRLIENALPSKWSYFVNRYQQIIVWGVLLLLMTGVLSRPIGWLSDAVLRLFGNLFHIPWIQRF